MNSKYLLSLSFTTLLILLCMMGAKVEASIPSAPSWGSNYQLVWGQDFTAMSTLSVSATGPCGAGGTTWMATKPGGGNWFNFEAPTSAYHPFNVGNGYLTIRCQQDGNDPNNWFGGFSAGILASVDNNGNGFSQQYGYFECSMWCPGSPNTWPGFWLLNTSCLTNPSLPYTAEVDITESYGNWGTGPNQSPPGQPNNDQVTWHQWGQNGNPTTSNSSYTAEPGMTTGYHTYGVDIEPTTTTWYFDRTAIWSAPTLPQAQTPMFVMVNLALGGGNYNNSTNTGYNWALTPNPTDLKVLYIAVWASPNSPNYTGGGAPPAPTGLSATGGNAQVSLSWTASSGATSYNVYRGTSSGGESGTALATGVTTTSYTDSTAANGTTYYYEVKAVNSSGTSGASNEASATPSSGGGSLPSPWVSQDVGSTGATGSSSYSGGTFTLNGAGGGAFYTPDSFQFAYQTISGDCSVIARVATQANTYSQAHAGVIIRDGLTGTAGFAEVTLLPNSGGAYFQYRADGGSPNSASSTGTAPYWVKITRTGNTFTGYVSSNGTTWTTVGSTTLTIPSTVYIGLLQASGIYGSLGTSTFDNVSVTGGGGGAPAAPTGLSATGGNAQVSLSWTASSGATSYNVYRGTSSGGESGTALITGVTTTSYIDSTAVNGTAYYYEVEAVNSSGTSGASNEASATPSSGGSGTKIEAESGTISGGAGIYADSFASGGEGVGYINVAGASVSLANCPAGSSLTLEYAAWGTGKLGLYINGTLNQLVTFPSTGAWTGAGAYSTITVSATIPSGATIKLQYDSGDAPANVDYIIIGGSGGGGSLPSPWLSQDVGSTGATGSLSVSGGTFTLNGAGGGAFYTPDSFQFAYQAVSGDCSVIARVATQANTYSQAHAGVIIRDGLTGTAGFAEVTLLPNSGGAYFQYRADGGSPNSASSTGTAPYWVKITRTGNTFTGYVSSNGTTWTTVGSTTLTMPSTVYIGLLQASGIYGSLGTSTFDNVTATP